MDKTEKINVILDNLSNTDPGVANSALGMLVQELRSSTSMASTIPKAFMHILSQKHLLKQRYSTLHGENKRMLADVLSVICAAQSGADALAYRMQGGVTSLEIWGHQYIKKLAGDIIRACTNGVRHQQAPEVSSQSPSRGVSPEKSPEESLEASPDSEYEHALHELSRDVVRCLFAFNSECDAIDLLIETRSLEDVEEHVDGDNVERVCAYLSAAVAYLEKEPKEQTLAVLSSIYWKHGRILEYAAAMIRRGKAEDLLRAVDHLSEAGRKQLAYILFSTGIRFTHDDPGIQSILSGKHMPLLNSFVASDLELDKAEKPKATGAIAEALANASFSGETITPVESRKAARISAQSAKGFLYLWNTEGAIAELEESLFSSDGYQRCSAVLALSIASCRSWDTDEIGLAVVRDSDPKGSATQSLVVLQSLILQYTGTGREDVCEVIRPYMADDCAEVRMFGMYALGAVYAGSRNPEIFSELVQVLSESTAHSVFSKYALLGVALIYLGAEGEVLDLLEAAESIGPLGSSLSILLRALAYFGTGSTKVIYELLRDALEEGSPSVSEETEEAVGPDYKHAFAMLGIALVSSGDETLAQMATHLLEGSLLLEHPGIQSSAPLALALLHLSTAKMEVVDALRRCAHSGETANIVAAVAALGLVAAGSSNLRVSAALEQTAAFCGKGAAASMLRMAQGLVHLGRGMLRVSMFNAGAPTTKAIGGILAFVLSALDGGSLVMDRYHFLLMGIAPSISPRYLAVLSPSGAPVKAKTRVGIRMDVSGVAGRPKKMSGVQVHEAPVILQSHEAAEVLGHRGVLSSSNDVLVLDQSD